MNNNIIIFLVIISLLFLLRVESFLFSSMKRAQYKNSNTKVLKANEDSTRGGAGVVEERKVETVDNVESKTQGKNRRQSLGSGSDERVPDGESNIHAELIHIIRSLKQQELLTSLKQDCLSRTEKLNLISLATKDELIPSAVVSGIMNDNQAINSFHLGAAGLFDEWNE